LQQIGCETDFDAVACQPLDAAIPGARSAKVVLDLEGGDQFYFQNSKEYAIHYTFANEHLSGDDYPAVLPLAQFNAREYYRDDRRFILGAVTYYEDPEIWALELAPYDTATAEMIEKLYRATAEAAYFGPRLTLHPDGLAESRVEELSDDVHIVTTIQIFAGITYQPLNLGTGVGLLRFIKKEDLEAGIEYVFPRDIVVLDQVPNDISAVAGLITEEFQTPLSHVNVLSQNRGTPNMGLKGATSDSELRALEGKWVKLVVGAFDYQIEEVDNSVADEAWQKKLDEMGEVHVPAYDLSVTDLRNIEDVVVETEGVGLRESIRAAIPTFGGKAAHYSVLADIGAASGFNVPKAFAIPIYYYDQFMKQHGLDAVIAAIIADPDLESDLAQLNQRLEALRGQMLKSTVDQGLQDLLRAKLRAEYRQYGRIRFRSSTNSEDLEGFTGAGLYDSATGVLSNWSDVVDAVRTVWSSVWFFRAFQERRYRGIDQNHVGMAVLVHHSFPEEEANGVAITANPYDTSGLEEAFYINVQRGDHSVVQPMVGDKTDIISYRHNYQNQPATYYQHSNLVPEGETVLTRRQLYDLGQALNAIHSGFAPAYAPAIGTTGWYAMDVEFKFDDDFGEPGVVELYVKQARPYPGRGQGTDIAETCGSGE
jgi:hypothetical protein